MNLFILVKLVERYEFENVVSSVNVRDILNMKVVFNY